MADHSIFLDAEGLAHYDAEATKRGVPPKVCFMIHATPEEVPEGYFYCDGTNGTPDMRETFSPFASNVTPLIWVMKGG